MVALGKITRTQGHAGAVRLLPFFFPRDLIEELKKPEVFVRLRKSAQPGGAAFERLSISRVWYHKQFIILEFEEISDMNAAERLRDQLLYVEPTNLWELKEDEYFAYELVGMQVCTESGQRLGEVIAVEDGPAHDYLRVRSTAKEFLVPFVRAMIRAVDKSSETIVAELPEGLMDL
jgi:16S rRNA processing protein RimM